jgi:hypothetical protein
MVLEDRGDRHHTVLEPGLRVLPELATPVATAESVDEVQFS